MTHTRRFHCLALVPLCLLLAVSATSAQTITPVMSGLDSPRGLAFGPERRAVHNGGRRGYRQRSVRGRGGGVELLQPNRKDPRLYRGKQERVVTGLPSIFNTMRRDVVGPNDIACQGRGTCFVTIGGGRS